MKTLKEWKETALKDFRSQFYEYESGGLREYNENGLHIEDFWAHMIGFISQKTYDAVRAEKWEAPENMSVNQDFLFGYNKRVEEQQSKYESFTKGV
jgi:hypothetical protein